LPIQRSGCKLAVFGNHRLNIDARNEGGRHMPASLNDY
jgi:hypothetical protein